MGVNLSLFDGIPTTKEAIKTQWENHIKNPKRYGIFKEDGGFLVQKRETKGKYKGYVCLWYYVNKPKVKYIKLIRIKDLIKPR